MVAHRLGKADLSLPHALGAALAAAMQEEDDGPLLVVVAAPVFRKVDLKAIGDSVQLDLAIQKAGLLLWFRVGGMSRARQSGRGLLR